MKNPDNWITLQQMIAALAENEEEQAMILRTALVQYELLADKKAIPCDCKYKHDICFCDGTCVVGG